MILCFCVTVLWFYLVGALFHYLMEGKNGIIDPENLFMNLCLGLACIGLPLVFLLITFNWFCDSLVLAVPGILLLGCAYRKSKLKDAGEKRKLETRDLLVITAALLITSFLLLISYADGVRSDYLSIWGFKALVLTNEGAVSIPSFMDHNHYHHHQDYPILFPSLHALVFRFFGVEMDRTIKMLYPLILASTALCFYFHLRKRYSFLISGIGVGLCLLAPGLCGHYPGICSGYMDTPLGCFILLAFLSAQDYITQGKATCALKAGLFLSAMVLIKNEGMAAAALALLVFLIASLRKDITRKAVACLLLPALLIGGSWFVFRMKLPAGSCDFLSLFMSSAFVDNISRLPVVLFKYLQEFFHFERWGFLWILTLISLPFVIKRGGAIMVVFLLGMFWIQISAIVVSPLGVEYQTNTAVARLVSQLAPLAVFCFVFGIGKRLRVSESH